MLGAALWRPLFLITPKDPASIYIHICRTSGTPFRIQVASGTCKWYCCLIKLLHAFVCRCARTLCLCCDSPRRCCSSLDPWTTYYYSMKAFGNWFFFFRICLCNLICYYPVVLVATSSKVTVFLKEKQSNIMAIIYTIKLIYISSSSQGRL